MKSSQPEYYDPRNYLLDLYKYLHLLDIDVIDAFLKNNPSLENKDPFVRIDYESIPFRKEINDFRQQVFTLIVSQPQFSNRSPELTSTKFNPLLFGDCSGLSGEVNPELKGDLTNLTGVIDKSLVGRISADLRGDITGVTGDVGDLTGHIRESLVGNVTALEGEISPRLKGNVSKIIGRLNKGFWGDCSELSGTVSFLIGNCSNLTGRVSNLTGDCSLLKGDCTGLEGDCTGKKANLSKIPWNRRPNRLENLSEFLSSGRLPNRFTTVSSTL